MQTIIEHIESFVPFGARCDGCPKGDPHGIKGYTGDVFCHMQEEVVPDGVKSCGFNEVKAALHR